MHGNPGEMVIVPKPGETIIWNNSTDPKKLIEFMKEMLLKW